MSFLEYALIFALCFFIFCQILNATLNFLTARSMRKNQKTAYQNREDEARHHFEQMEAINIKLAQILEMLDNPKPVKVIRGKYKPRRPKEIEHKKTPP